MGGYEAVFNHSCTSIPEYELKARNISRCVSAMICTLITLIVLLVLIFKRAYKTTLQRLFLYLTTVVLLQLIFISMNIELQFDFEQKESICTTLAFFTAWTAASTYLLAMVITLNLLYTMCRKMRGYNTYMLIQSFLWKKVLKDIILVLTCVCFPLCYLWIPFYHGSFGNNTSIACWIIHTRETDCQFLGFGDQISMGFGMYYIISFFVVVAFVAVATLFCIFAAKYKLTRRYHLKVICQTLSMITCIVISALIQAFGLVQHFYNTVSGEQIPFEVSVIYDGAIPFSQMIIPLGFLFYSYSVRKCCTHCRCKRTNSRHYYLCNSSLTGQAPPSTRVEPPSDTYFETPYTGEFTSIDN